MLYLMVQVNVYVFLVVPAFKHCMKADFTSAHQSFHLLCVLSYTVNKTKLKEHLLGNIDPSCSIAFNYIYLDNTIFCIMTSEFLVASVFASGRISPSRACVCGEASLSKHQIHDIFFASDSPVSGIETCRVTSSYLSLTILQKSIHNVKSIHKL